MDKMNKYDVADLINLVYCSFFGIGFIYSDSVLFSRLGGLFLVWTCFYTVYNRYRGSD